MVLHNAHNYKQGVAITLNPIELTESSLNNFSIICLYVSHHMCVNPVVTRPGISTFSHDSLHVLASPQATHCIVNPPN